MSNKSSLRWKLEDVQKNPRINLLLGNFAKLDAPAKHVTEVNSGKIIIDLPPFPSPRMVRSDKWAKRPVVVKYFQWRKDFVLLCKQQHYTLSGILTITFVIEMPRSWGKKTKEVFDGRPHKQRPDLDNLTKSVMDAFGMEDGFVWKINTEKYWGRKGTIIITR